MGAARTKLIGIKRFGKAVLQMNNHIFTKFRYKYLFKPGLLIIKVLFKVQVDSNVLYLKKC